MSLANIPDLKDVRVNELFDEFTPTAEHRLTIAFQNFLMILRSAKVISERSSPLQHMGGQILGKIEPPGCALAGRRERKYYSSHFFERKRIVVTIRRVLEDEVVQRDIRVTQYIPRPEVVELAKQLVPG